MKARNEPRVTQGIALDGEYWGYTRHGQLSIIPDATVKENTI